MAPKMFSGVEQTNRMPFSRTISKANQFSSAVHHEIPHFWKYTEKKEVQMEKGERGNISSVAEDTESDASFVLVTIFIKRTKDRILFTRKKFH